MKVLLLGNSDTAGLYTPGDAWPALVSSAIESRIGEPVTWEETRFSVLFDNAPRLAEDRVREADPDIVILPVVSFQMNVAFVWPRIRRLFGQRAGRRWRRWEERFDTRTRDKGRVSKAMNRAARAITRRLIGTEPITNREQLTGHYLDVIRTLSRVEDTQFMLLPYPGTGRWASKPRAAAERRQLMTDVRAAGEAHRFLFVDASTTAQALPDGAALFSADGFHLSPAGHDFMAGQLTGALEQAGLVPASAKASAPSG